MSIGRGLGVWNLVWLAMLVAGTILGQTPSVRAQVTGDPTFDVVNGSQRTIFKVFVSLSTESEWGRDRLGDSVVMPGANFRIDLPQGPCEWDVAVEYEDGQREDRRKQNLCELSELTFEGTQARADARSQGNPSFELVNDSGKKILLVFASLAGQPWGDDRLGEDKFLESGERFQIDLPYGPCRWNILVVYEDGRREVKSNENLCSTFDVTFDGSAATAAPRRPATPVAPRARASDDPSFALVNKSGRPLFNLYAYLSTDRSRGEDRLGENVLMNDERHWIDLPRGQCRWNIEVVYDNGGREERRALDLCSVSELVFDGSGISSAEKPSVALPATPVPVATPVPSAQVTKAENECEGKEEATREFRNFADGLDTHAVSFAVPANIRVGSEFRVIASVQPLADMTRLRNILPKIWCVEVRDFALKAELREGGTARGTLESPELQPISTHQPTVWTWKVVAGEPGLRNLTLALHGVGRNPPTGQMIKEFPRSVEIVKIEPQPTWFEKLVAYLERWGKVLAAIAAIGGAIVGLIEMVRRIVRGRGSAGA